MAVNLLCCAMGGKSAFEDLGTKAKVVMNETASYFNIYS